MTIIVGTGALEDELKRQAKELELTNTHFVGLQGPDVIRPLQNLADVSLIPSRKEPFGLVVIEGTACGHPVIGTNSGGIPDIMNITGKIIKEHYNPEVDGQDPTVLAPNSGTKGTYTTPLGMLVPVDDSDELANATLQILNGTIKFDNDAIADYTKRTYSQEAINKELLDLFNQSIAELNQSKKLVLKKSHSQGPSLDD